MSLEYLPPDDIYPNEYHVRLNQCNCHPETCACNDYAIYDKHGEKLGTFFDESEAERMASLMNEFDAEENDETP